MFSIILSVSGTKDKVKGKNGDEGGAREVRGRGYRRQGKGGKITGEASLCGYRVVTLRSRRYSKEESCSLFLLPLSCPRKEKREKRGEKGDLLSCYVGTSGTLLLGIRDAYRPRVTWDAFLRPSSTCLEKEKYDWAMYVRETRVEREPKRRRRRRRRRRKINYPLSFLRSFLPCLQSVSRWHLPPNYLIVRKGKRRSNTIQRLEEKMRERKERA